MNKLRRTANVAPIAAAFSSMSGDERVVLRRKFDIAYVLAKERLFFRKFPTLCELETWHGINLGLAYKTAKAFIAVSQRQELVHTLFVITE